MSTTVHLLGAARAEREGRVFAFLPDRRYQLLAYLAYRGGWVDREELAFLFWPDSPPETARVNFRQLLARVRALDAAPGLEVERGRLRWAVATDVAALTEAVAAGRWGEALTLGSGDLMARLEGDAPGEFADWLGVERGRVRDLRRGAVLRRAGELTQEGAHLEAAEVLEPLLGGDELDEEALQAQVEALWRAGGREQARRIHAAFVTRLREELDLDPTAELEALGRALRDGRGPGPAAPSPSPGASPGGNLPSATTSFIGRDLELAEIVRLLTSPDCRLLTLVGPGGVGKTRLSLEAARNLTGSYPDGVFFVPLEALSSGTLIVPSVASALGLTLQGQADPLEQVARSIGQRRLLLVLDNFEGLLEGAHLAAELVRRCPGLCLLVTSRERLGVEGEWLLPVGGLDYPREGEPAPAEGAYFDAVQLFVERARRVRPDFGLSAENFPHLLRICRLVEGSPLGLELAAVWVRLLPLSQVALEIGGNLDFLADERGRAERHRNLRAVFEGSWRRLTPPEQETLRRLSVFRGGFRLEAARQVAGATLPVLAALVDKSLLRLSQAGRYDRHALVSQYTRERLAEHPEEEARTVSLHGRYYLSFLAEQSKENARPGGQAAVTALGRSALSAVDEELENLRAAWGWAVEGGRVEELARATRPWAGYLISRAHYREGFALCGKAAAALGGDGRASLYRLALGQMLIFQGAFGLFLGRHDEARRLTERGLALMPPGSSVTANGHNMLGLITARTGHYAEAERRYRKALALTEREGDEGRQAGILSNLAALEAVLGRLDEAEQHVGQALALCRHFGFQVGTVDGLNVRGAVALAAGRLTEAQASLEGGLALARELDLRAFIPDLLLSLAHVAFEEGDLSEARRLSEEGLAAARVSASLAEEIGALSLLGRTSAVLGADEDARCRLEEGLRLALAHHETPRLLEGLTYLAEFWAERGRAREAASLFHLARHHPGADHRLKVLAGRRLEGLRLSPRESAEAASQGDPGRLEALATAGLAWLDPTGDPRPD